MAHGAAPAVVARIVESMYISLSYPEVDGRGDSRGFQHGIRRGAGAGGSSGGTGRPPPPRVSGGASGADFDYRQLVPSFIQTAREVLLNPVNFFRSIRREGDFVSPLVFAIICALISAVLTGVIGFLFNVIAGNGIGGSIGSLISTIIFVPIATAIGLFIWAAIYHLLVLLIVRPSHGGYESTFRVVAYASALQLVSWLGAIPILGIVVLLVILVYSVVLSVLGYARCIPQPQAGLPLWC